MFKKSLSGNVLTMNAMDASINNDLIKKDYWSRLSPQAVQYSASLIDLFFKEAQAAKEAHKLNPVPIEKKTSFFGQLINNATNWLANILTASQDAFSEMFGGSSKLETIDEFTTQSEAPKQPKEQTPPASLLKPVISLDKSQIARGDSLHLIGVRFVKNNPVDILIERPDKIKINASAITDSQGGLNYQYSASAYDPLGVYYISVKDSVSGIITDRVKFELRESLDPQREKIIKEEGEDSKESLKTSKPAETLFCDFNAATSAGQKVIINEIAWMGSTTSANSEWIELKNISAEKISLAGWQIVAKDASIKIVFPATAEISPGGFYLLERTDDASVPGVTADLIYSGALSNSGESLKLFNASCAVIDVIAASDGWPAGAATSRKTMERDVSGFGWHTSSFVEGTPKQENSIGESTKSGGGGGSSSVAPNQIAWCGQAIDDIPTRQILINEVAWAGDSASSSSEWIELKNVSQIAISLAGWQLLDKTNDIKIIFSDTDNLPAGGFYLLERGSQNFISGILADKLYSGALNNSDETLRLFNQNCGLVDQVIDVGANWQNIGGSTPPEYRTAERTNAESWHTYNGAGANGVNGTPKAENSAPGAGGNQNEEIVAPKAGHVVISEIMVGKSGAAEDEFVELYNPTDQPVVLDGWELRKKVVSSGNETNLLDSDAFIGTIPAKGFFLITHANYAGSLQPNIRYSTDNSLAYSDNAVLLYNADHAIGGVVDEVAYEGIVEGKSLERKAWNNGFCLDAFSDEGEFLGNGCGTSNTATGFSERMTPRPQNVSSLLEPREAPAALTAADWQINYNFDKASVDFTLPINDAVNYRILDVINDETTNSGLLMSGTFSKRIDEIGRDYRYQVKAVDRDGLASEYSDFKSINIPSYIKNASFYRAVHRGIQGDEVDEPIFEFSYDIYPFMPRDANLALAYGEPAAPNYKIMVLYLNRDAPKSLFLDGEFPSGEYSADILKTRYDICGGVSNSERSSIVLADAAEGCNIFIGGIPNSAMVFNTYLSEGDNHLSFSVIKPSGEASFSSEDFITVAFYGLYRFYPAGDMTKDIFKLLAVDSGHYSFGDVPSHRAPSMSGEINTSFDAIKSELTWSAPAATDPDSLDALLRYEVSYDGGSAWETGALVNRKNISPSSPYSLRIKAIDDFGITSEILQKDYIAPDVPVPFGLSNLSWKNDVGLGQKILNFDYQNYPFITGGPGFKAMIFYFNRLPPESYSGGYSGGDYAQIQTKHFSCIDYDPANPANIYRDFPILILAETAEAVEDSFGSNTTGPNRCLSWTNLPRSGALVPVPGVGSGRIILETSGILNSDKTMETLTASDFFTIGFYEFDLYGNGVLLANDGHKYYFAP
ncbi:MAG: lamin tail domain-containing protein [Patescibacteria group bacterium]|nr:lamin tail domain-containing protein [Patescibacteria group bacterium]